MERQEDHIDREGFRVTDDAFRATLRELFQELHPKLVYFARRAIRDIDDARDVVLGKWVEILADETRTYPNKRAFSNYLFNGVRMRVGDYQRSKMEEGRLKEYIKEYINERNFDYPNFDQLIVFRKQRFIAATLKEVFNAIHDLPRRQKAAMLGLLAEKSTREIAIDMDATEGAVRTYIARARATLSERFAGSNLEVTMALIALGFLDELAQYTLPSIHAIST